MVIEFSIILFGIGGVVGILVLYQILCSKEASRLVINTHLAIAVVGMILLMWCFIQHPVELYLILGLFWIAAILGIINLAVYAKRKKPSKLLALAHTASGVVALTMLVFYYSMM